MRTDGPHSPTYQQKSRNIVQAWLVFLALTVSIVSCNVPRVGPITGEWELPTFPAPSVEHPTPQEETATPQTTYEGNPPSGRIVYTCSIDGFDQICLMDANGGNIMRLTNEAVTDFYASISPDGNEVVFSSKRSGA